MTPDVYDVLLALRFPDGLAWGEAATELQLQDAASVLRPGNGPRRHWLGRPRGYSKTLDVAACTLSAMLAGLVSAECPAYAAAADRQQAALLLDSLAAFVRNTPGLADAVELQTWRAVVRGSGAQLDVLAADSSGSYGLRPSWCVIDELTAWPDTRGSRTFLEALTSSWPKVPGSVALIISTAGSPGHFSRAVYDNALAEPDLWRVSEVHTAAPWIDPQLIEAERRSLTESAFARLWQNRWATGDDALVSAEDLEAAATHDGALDPVPGRTYITAVDVGLVNDRTVVVVAHAEHNGQDPPVVVVDRLWRFQGTKRRPVDLSTVEAVILEAHQRYPGTVIADPYQAAQLAQRLKARGVSVRTFDFTTTSVGRLASTMLQLLRSRRLHLPRGTGSCSTSWPRSGWSRTRRACQGSTTSQDITTTR